MSLLVLKLLRLSLESLSGGLVNVFGFVLLLPAAFDLFLVTVGNDDGVWCSEIRRGKGDEPRSGRFLVICELVPVEQVVEGVASGLVGSDESKNVLLDLLSWSRAFQRAIFSFLRGKALLRDFFLDLLHADDLS